LDNDENRLAGNDKDAETDDTLKLTFSAVPCERHNPALADLASPPIISLSRNHENPFALHSLLLERSERSKEWRAGRRGWAGYCVIGNSFIPIGA
jgi:hypothetical protein